LMVGERVRNAETGLLDALHADPDRPLEA
jgi:hypothetical protein